MENFTLKKYGFMDNLCSKLRFCVTKAACFHKLYGKINKKVQVQAPSYFQTYKCYLILMSRMTRKSNRTHPEEIFAEEDEYRPRLRRCISLFNAEKQDYRKEHHTCLLYLCLISLNPCFISLSTNARTSFGVIRHFVTSPWKVSWGISSNKSSFVIL